MAVSSPATLSSVYAEFNAPAGTPLSAFLRGGAYVPNTGANAAVPTALPIRLGQLAGAVKYTSISLNGPAGANASLTVPPPGNATQPMATSPATVVTVTGGNPSPTVAWSHVSGDATVSVSNPSSLSTTFTATVNRNTTKSAVKRCTVSDGVTSATWDVSVSLEYYTSA